VEVEDDLSERQLVRDDDAVCRGVLDALLLAAALLAEAMTAPTYSCGTWIVAFTIGSSIRSMYAAAAACAGLSTLGLAAVL
jgi:hypothetical protein